MSINDQEILLETMGAKLLAIDPSSKEFAQLADAYARTYAAMTKQIELDAKQKEQENKVAIENKRLAAEAMDARKAHRLEVAKFVLSCCTGTVGTVIALAALKDGGLTNNLLKSVRLFKN